MTEQEAKDLLIRFREDKCSSQENILIDAWYVHSVANYSNHISDQAKSDLKQIIWNNIDPDQGIAP